MEAVATSLDAVAAKKRGPLLSEGLTVGPEPDDPPLFGMAAVYGPSAENRPGSGAVQAQNIAPVPKDLCPPYGL